MVFSLCSVLTLGNTADVSAQQSLSSWEATRWSTSLRMGLEYDDNPLRLESHDHTGDALTRYLLGADIVTDLRDSGQVSVSLRHGGKIFRREHDASALLTQALASAQGRLHQRLSVQARGDIKDRSEGVTRQDYTRGGIALRAMSNLSDFHFYAETGWRFFAFKPAPTSSHQGPLIAAGLGWTPRNDLSLRAALTRVWRRYDSTAWAVDGDFFVPYPGGERRRDDYDSARLDLRYQRWFSARLSYSFSLNRSNSFGQGLRRHGLRLNATAPLGWDLFLSAGVDVKRTRYDEPLLVDEIFVLDEDNRNTLAIALARHLGERWEMELLYNLYAQEFGVDGEYRRQTLLLTFGFFLDGTNQ